MISILQTESFLNVSQESTSEPLAHSMRDQFSFLVIVIIRFLFSLIVVQRIENKLYNFTQSEMSIWHAKCYINLMSKSSLREISLLSSIINLNLFDFISKKSKITRNESHK